jgi:hypothetical protein
MAATITIVVSDAAVRAMAIYTNNAGIPVQITTLENLIDKWGREYLLGALSQRKAAIQAAIDVDEAKLAAAETAVGL